MFTFKFLCVIPFILSGHFRVKYDVNMFFTGSGMK